MEAELWKQVYKLVTKMAKGKTIKRATYTDGDIILTYMWAVLHDRPIYWACKKRGFALDFSAIKRELKVSGRLFALKRKRLDEY